MSLTIRVLCWDHPRCTGPVAAAARAYAEVRPDVTVRWGTRPLSQFNDQPIWEIDEPYDLVFVDHPMAGAIAARSAATPLESLLPDDELERIQSQSIGASHRSYTWAGSQWALGVDATSHVSALHTKRLAGLSVETPRTWDDVLRLAASSPGAVALPLDPSDALCTLISLSANAALTAEDQPHWLRPEGVEMLTTLAGSLDPACFDLNPPRLLARMTSDDSPIAYVPHIFGYASAARAPMAFADVPGVDGRPLGAILGGAGLAVVPTSAHPTEAAAFAGWLSGERVQRELVVPAGGQPGGRGAWDDPPAGPDTVDYFRATRGSIEHAYVRPRDPWWPRFQREAGVRLVELLRDGASPGRVHDDLDALADQHRNAHPVEVRP